MEEKHKLTYSIINSMKTLLKGEVNFVENYSNWVMSVSVKWNKRTTTIYLNSRKKNLETEFVNCTLSKAQFLTFLSRSETYNFSGNKSKYSELLLESIETQHLMDSKKPIVKLDGKCLIFKGRIRKKDFSSLSNVFILFEFLMNKIDALQGKV